MMTTITIFLSVICSIFPPAQKTNASWDQELSQIHRDFKQCSEADADECRTYIGKAFSVVYGIEDFKHSSGQYFDVSDIGGYVSENPRWEVIGAAYDNKVLARSQQLANDNQAVLALYKNKEGVTMHVAIILPGDLVPSGSWGLEVPNAASLPTFDPDHSFINKGLSYAFEKRNLLNVKIYARKK
jgi:hypothetical protein